MVQRSGVRVWVSRAVGVLLLTAVAILALLGGEASWSPSGWVLLTAAAVAAASSLAGAARVRRAGWAAAGAAIAVLVIVRLLAAGAGMPTLPAGTSSRWLSRIVDEQDVALLGARLLVRRWPVVREERDGLVREMRAAYAEMRRDAGGSPSPLLDTTFGRQGPDGFDALVFEAPSAAPRAAVVFLHGYAGSFRLECWLVAQAARAIDALTVCPATGFRGHWSDRDGERTLRATLDHLHGRGVRRVYLAGLSNGAAGASALAPKLASRLSGLILISGAPAGGTAARLPALVVHGEHDPMASAAAARAFAARAQAGYVGLEGGHFVLLMQRARARDAIAAWLREREGRNSGREIPEPSRR